MCARCASRTGGPKGVIRERTKCIDGFHSIDYGILLALNIILILILKSLASVKLKHNYISLPTSQVPICMT
jgi:hypothetical protein